MIEQDSDVEIGEEMVQSLENELNSEEFLEKINRVFKDHHEAFELEEPSYIAEIKFKVSKDGRIGLNFIQSNFWKIFDKVSDSPKITDYARTLWGDGLKKLISGLTTVRENFEYTLNSKKGFINLTFIQPELEKNDPKNEENEGTGEAVDPKIAKILKKHKLLEGLDKDGNLNGFNIFEKRKRKFEL